MTTVPPAFPDDTPEDPSQSAQTPGSSAASVDADVSQAADADAAAEASVSAAPAPKTAKPRTPAKPRSTPSATARKKPAARPTKAQGESTSAPSAEQATGAAEGTSDTTRPAAKPARATSPAKPRTPRASTGTAASKQQTSAAPGAVETESSEGGVTGAATSVPTAAAAKPAARKTTSRSTGTARKAPTRKAPAVKQTPIEPTASAADLAPGENSVPETVAPSSTEGVPTVAPLTAEPGPVEETAVGREQGDAPVLSEPFVDSTSTTPTPAKKNTPRQPAATKTGAPRARVAASVAKSPSEVVEHAAPKATLDASQIPPVPPLPVVPPVPPLPTDVAVVDGSAVPPHADSSETRHTAAHDADASVDAASDGEQESTVGPADDADESSLVLNRASGQPAPSLDELPPLPEISAEEAALQFETRPDAAEQATGLESHEPMKFVWSKRWPFLSLVPATAAAEVLPSPTAVSDDTRDAESDDLTELLDLSADSDELAAERSEAEPLEFPADDARVDDAPVSNTATAIVDDPAPVRPVAEAADESALEALVAIEPENATTAYPVGTDSPTEILSTDPATKVLTTDSATEVLTTDPATEVLSTDSATEVFAARLATGVLPDEPDTEILPDGSVTDAGSGEPVARVAEPLPTATADAGASPVVLSIRNLSRSFGDTVAVDGIDLEVREGSFYGIVGPNGAGKTTTLSMITGLLRPDSGTITVHGIDVWENPDKAKRSIGVLPDRLRLFDRLTGAQLLYYSGVLRGLDGATVRSRVKDLAVAFGLEDALNRLVTDYSAGMTKKVALASAMIHSPRLLVLDEPFESVDPVSAANVIEILQKYVAHGGTVVLSSHGMDLIQRVCDHVAIVVNGQVLAAGAVDDVRGHGTLEDRFVELAGGRKAAEGMEWLHSFSD